MKKVQQITGHSPGELSPDVMWSHAFADPLRSLFPAPPPLRAFLLFAEAAAGEGSLSPTCLPLAAFADPCSTFSLISEPPDWGFPKATLPGHGPAQQLPAPAGCRFPPSGCLTQSLAYPQFISWYCSGFFVHLFYGNFFSFLCAFAPLPLFNAHPPRYLSFLSPRWVLDKGEGGGVAGLIPETIPPTHSKRHRARKIFSSLSSVFLSYIPGATMCRRRDLQALGGQPGLLRLSRVDARPRGPLAMVRVTPGASFSNKRLHLKFVTEPIIIIAFYPKPSFYQAF